MIVEVTSLDGFGGPVGVEESDTFTAGMAGAKSDRLASITVGGGAARRV